MKKEDLYFLIKITFTALVETTAERVFLGTILYSRAPLTESRRINGRKIHSWRRI